MPSPRLLWFRRDLRLADHPALVEAAARGPVIGLFVIDPVLWDRGGVRTAYLARSLAALNASLGGRLVIRRGRPSDVVPDTAREAGAAAVHVSADHGPYGAGRDHGVAVRLKGDGIAWSPAGSPYAVDPGTVRKPDGTSYRVFTPFYRAWSTVPVLPVHDAPAVDWRTLPGEPLPEVPLPDGLTLPAAGEAAALDRWQRFRAAGVAAYADHRDRPDLDGTTVLSHALRWGELHPRTMLADLGMTGGEESLRRELCWREFYADVLHHAPDSAWHDLREDLGRIEVDAGPDADARFEAWCAGRTGYPFVDAGMRQLLAEGWMHNRVRMVVASFLVKNLRMHWLHGARWFWDTLVDADLASNTLGWQWAAGCGADAAPYFRVFNPQSQAEKFDPQGEYLRRWLPELSGRGGASYPPPIVDLKASREAALAAFRTLRET